MEKEQAENGKSAVIFLQEPCSNLTEALEQCSSYPVALFRSSWRKFTDASVKFRRWPSPKLLSFDRANKKRFFILLFTHLFVTLQPVCVVTNLI